MIMLVMDAHHHEMMKDFHEPRTDKRSIVVIPHHRLEEWLALKQPNILSFIEGFPVEEFECFYCPKQRHNKNTPQMSMFD